MNEREVTDLGEHILLYENFFPEEMIDDWLNTWEECKARGLTIPRHKFDTSDIRRKKDDSLGYLSMPYGYIPQSQDMLNIIEGDIFDDLFERYPQLRDTYRMLFVSGGRIQETEPQGGYHAWHHEQSWDMTSRQTILAWSLFLNDVEDGGELEFLYQSLRVKPVRNHFLLWPAGYTHLHRGNPPLKDPKLIFTGWIDFA